MPSITEYAENELRKTDLYNTDGMYGDMLAKAVMELIQTFSDQGHSGMSASITRQVFARLADNKPLTPLTGEDDEWFEASPRDTFLQNKRCYSVFKDIRTGAVWHHTDDGNVSVTFPYIVP